jgi:hypothetical protein
MKFVVGLKLSYFDKSTRVALSAKNMHGIASWTQINMSSLLPLPHLHQARFELN